MNLARINSKVLLHDDISDKFSSAGFSADNTLIESLDADFGNYLIQIVDPDTFDTQFSEVVVLTDEDDVILFEKTTDFTTLKLGNLKTEITSGETKNLFTSDGQLKGCFLLSLLINPSNKLPFENATLANLAVETRNLFFFERISFSIKLFEAPIIFTGFVALSVETLKKYFGEFSSHKLKSFIAR